MSAKGVFLRTNWLNAATSTQTTSAEEVLGYTTYTLQVASTGSPTNVVVLLQGSLDGVDWFTLTSANPISSPQIVYAAPGAAPGGFPVRYIRLNLSQLSGGSSPTVTASVIAV